MSPFQPIIFSNHALNRFEHKGYSRSAGEEIIYKGKRFERITYYKHHEFFWRIGRAVLAALASLTLLPFLINSKGMKALWKEVCTGDEYIVVLIAKKNETQVNSLLVKGILKKGSPHKVQEKEVGFKEQRARTYRPEEAPVLVNEQISQVKRLETPSSLVSEVKGNVNHREQQRRIPPVACIDTLVFKNGKLVSEHGEGILFQDSDILEKEPIERFETLKSSDVVVRYTKHNKPIIQQQATRGCTAAVTAMLIKEHGGEVDLHKLKNTNLGNEEKMRTTLEGAGFKVLLHTPEPMNYLQELRKYLQAHGSAIVSVGSSIGGHVMIVDEVSSSFDQVRLRDPYHGWEITVKAEAFLRENPSYIQQIQSN